MLTICLLLSLAPGADPASFVLHRAEGSDLSGPLQNIGDDWSVGLGGSTPSLTEGSKLISIRRKETALPARPADAHIILANGDRLSGSASELAAERLTFRPNIAGNPQMTVPLSSLAVIWLAEPAGVGDSALLRRRLLAETRRRDVVWLRNGDVVEGTVTRLDKDGFHVEAEGKEVVVERSKVAYVAFSTLLMRALTPKGPYGHLILTDGSRLGIVSPQGDARVLKARTLFGADVKVPVELIVSLDIRQGRAVYLSDLKPASYKYTPFTQGLTWPYVVDGSVEQGTASGRDLCLNGSTFDKGLGLHSECRISYTLAGGYRRFEALAGMNAGSARLKVLVDGKAHALAGDKDVTAADAPLPVQIDVTGAKELTLVVEFGRGGLDPGGRVSWADARLIK